MNDGPWKRVFWIGLGRWRITFGEGGMRFERTELLLVGFGIEEWAE